MTAQANIVRSDDHERRIVAASRVAEILNRSLFVLAPAERLEIFDLVSLDFCKHCGAQHQHDDDGMRMLCQCWNDE